MEQEPINREVKGGTTSTATAEQLVGQPDPEGPSSNTLEGIPVVNVELRLGNLDKPNQDLLLAGLIKALDPPETN